MIVWCGSHTKWYVPFFNFTVHFVVVRPMVIMRICCSLVRREERGVSPRKRAGRRSAAHRDEPQVGTAVIRQRRVRLGAMRSERAASDHEQTLGRTSLLILAALSLAAVAWRVA
jgi:hypothetical protein